MALTYPMLNRIAPRPVDRHWTRDSRNTCTLRAGDLSIPAGGVNRYQALILAECAAAGQPDPAAVNEGWP